MATVAERSNNNFKFLADSSVISHRDSELTLNSTSLVSTGLTFDVKEGETWVFEVNLFATLLDSTAQLRTKVEAPTNSTGRYSMVNVENQGVKSADINVLMAGIAVSDGNDDLIQIKGLVVAGADGTVDPMLRNGNTTNTQTFSEFSYITAQRLA